MAKIEGQVSLESYFGLWDCWWAAIKVPNSSINRLAVVGKGLSSGGQ